MIQIDMPMPTNCHGCPACNEYLMCAIPVNGRSWGENDVREYGQSRPEWCPLKEQKAVEPYSHLTDDSDLYFTCGKCWHVIWSESYKYCPMCGLKIAWNGEGR